MKNIAQGLALSELGVNVTSPQITKTDIRYGRVEREGKEKLRSCWRLDGVGARDH